MERKGFALAMIDGPDALGPQSPQDERSGGREASGRGRGVRLLPEVRAELRRALLAGERPSRIAKRLGVTRAAVTYHLKTLPPVQPGESPPPMPATEEGLAEASRSDREWLEWFRSEASGLPDSERLRAAIALEKGSSGAAPEAWTPPASPEQWAECLAELLLCQAPGVLDRVRELIEPPEPPG